MRRRLFLAGLLVLAGCSSPDPNYYTLRAVPGTVLTGEVKLVELRRSGLAGYLDRPEIVRTQADYRLSIGNGDHWGEPLGALVARTLAEDLNLRLPGTSVFTSQGSISADPDVTVELDLQRFDADASGQVVMLAQVAVTRTPGRDHAAAQTVRLVVTPTGATTTALVAALSTALGQLADRIAAMLVR
jgi:uncharacterized lipoprotein YmbA